MTEEQQKIARIRLAQYENEPCRICGQLLTMDDLLAGAVWKGYSTDSVSRAAHKACAASNPPQSTWSYPDDAPVPPQQPLGPKPSYE